MMSTTRRTRSNGRRMKWKATVSVADPSTHLAEQLSRQPCVAVEEPFGGVPAFAREVHPGGTPVRRVRMTCNEGGGLEPVDETRHGPGGHSHGVRQLALGGFRASCEFPQHVGTRLRQPPRGEFSSGVALHLFNH